MCAREGQEQGGTVGVAGVSRYVVTIEEVQLIKKVPICIAVQASDSTRCGPCPSPW